MRRFYIIIINLLILYTFIISLPDDLIAKDFHLMQRPGQKAKPGTAAQIQSQLIMSPDPDIFKKKGKHTKMKVEKNQNAGNPMTITQKGNLFSKKQ